jgi:hypothetical protein
LAADARIGADDRVGADDRSGPDLGAGPDHGARVDHDARLQPRGGVNEGARRNAALLEDGTWFDRVRKQARHRFGHRAIGLRGLERRAAGRRLRHVARREKHCGGARGVQLGEIARVVQEGKSVGACDVERRDIAHEPFGIAVGPERRAGPLRDLPQGRSERETEETDLGQPAVSSGREKAPRRPDAPQETIQLRELRT